MPRPLDAAPGRTVRGAVAAANGHATIVARQEVCSCGECVEARAGALHGPSVVFGGEDVEGAAAAAIVAATEQATVVAYEIRSDVARVRIAFIPSRGQPIAVPSLRGSQSQPGIATDGETFLVTWLENDDQCRLQVVAAVMDASGRFGPPVQLSDKPVALSPPAVTWNGSEYAVAWNRLYSQVAAVRVTRFGRPLGAPIDLTDEEPGDLSSLSIAWTGNGYAAGWSERIHVNHDPFDAYEYRLRALGPDLRPSAPVAVLGPGTSGNIAWNGLEAVVFRRSGSRMEMAHLDADGRAGESKYVAVYLPTLLDPSVAWHNGEWLVTGVGPTGGRIARVTGDGNVVEDIDILEGDEHTPLSAVRVAATPSRVAVTVETFNPPQTVTVRTTDPQPPRHHVVRGLP